ncbi:hypothetical protein [Sinorhizobium medicae]|uniref:hypothetical protein n=1 Tax=Sinorhizobium medicae TaxID=110321 RepID=UPI001AAF2C48|nr:hypothetical protein [Sinorhizobium medicae]MBO1965279.1 hypothetical protein [Sinorhizobium medicae]MDW9359758.1 hypothetical protein [Sinorhizobium meliloti]MDW9943733.1 hypothetical protein [Sinorhizobium meliloti]WQP41099.1 hypothetical protein U8C38_26525 [Sinorhizobium medicae]
MTPTESLDFIKNLSKKLARARRIKRSIALDVTAQQLGYPHWNALTAAHKKGWRPTATQIETMMEIVVTLNPLKAKEAGNAGLEAFSGVPGIALIATIPRDPADPFSADVVLGELDRHKFRLRVDCDDVFMEGRGWRIIVPEAPSARPEASVTDRRVRSNPILDEGFAEKALRVAQIRAEQVRARIASDWPRRSTVPDADGKVQHPLFGSSSDRWFCFHCDQIFPGTQIAKNLWHCLACSASPIDIHPADEQALWNNEEFEEGQ